mmetsp:Transcript_37019/g.102921  ORF Transcript_37019/g.102921 Transcript_37019/m.102921 type:complete len:220 (+) Transcript_37019:95-754(+)
MLRRRLTRPRKQTLGAAATNSVDPWAQCALQALPRVRQRPAADAAGRGAGDAEAARERVRELMEQPVQRDAASADRREHAAHAPGVADIPVARPDRHQAEGDHQGGGQAVERDPDQERDGLLLCKLTLCAQHRELLHQLLTPGKCSSAASRQRQGAAGARRRQQELPQTTGGQRQQVLQGPEFLERLAQNLTLATHLLIGAAKVIPLTVDKECKVRAVL